MVSPTTELTGLAALDDQRLKEALTLAEQSIGLSDPNPRVGCIIGHADGRVIGAGHTQRAGEAHAEVMALRWAQAQGLDTFGATAWVTLEPCSHHGRTPPCCDALSAAGITRVVCAMEDPNPLVNGRGIARLREQGITVIMAPAELAEAAQALNVGFAKRMRSGQPWIRLKMAASLDGITALHNGVSQWITGPDARADGQSWRRRAQAIVTGVGTILADDPRLDVRTGQATPQPMRVIVDSTLRTPVSARTLQCPGRVVIASCGGDEARASALASAGASVLALPGTDKGQVDLGALVDWLSRQAVNEVHVEAGPRLAGALLADQLVDELLLYLAPMLLGPGGHPMAQLPMIDRLDEALELDLRSCERIGKDLRLLTRILKP